MPYYLKCLDWQEKMLKAKQIPWCHRKGENRKYQPRNQVHFLYSFNSIQKGSCFPLKKSIIISDRHSASLILKPDFWVTVNCRTKNYMMMQKAKRLSSFTSITRTIGESHTEQNFDFYICIRDFLNISFQFS